MSELIRLLIWTDDDDDDDNDFDDDDNDDDVYHMVSTIWRWFRWTLLMLTE